MVVCYLCKSSKEDVLQYGDMLQNDRMAVHTFCLYLSSNLPQNGEDEEGLLGFLEDDIIKEARRVSHLNCCYCQKIYANVGCCNTKCRYTFHFICGLENGATNEFCGSYQSYCHQHGSKSKFSLPPKNESCSICLDTFLENGKRSSCLTSIQAPCCRNGWFHKLCLLRSAKVAGYFFKCPLCNDVQVFRQQLLMQGIFIPNQDAAWELEPNAFAELLERPNKCIVSDCSCSAGRTSSSNENPLLLCSLCGSSAMHKNCMPNANMSFYCADCSIIRAHNNSQETFNKHGDNSRDDDDQVDVCNFSDKEDLETLRSCFSSTPSKAIEKNAIENAVHNSSDSSVDEVSKVPIRRRKRLLSTDSSDSEKACEKPRSSRRRIISSSSDGGINSSVIKENRRLRSNKVLPSHRNYSEDDYSQASTSRTPSQHTKRNVGDMSKNGLISDTEESCKDEIVSISSISSDELCISRRSNKRSKRAKSSDEDYSENSTPEKRLQLHSQCDTIRTPLDLNTKKEKITQLETKSNDGHDSADEEFSSSTDNDDPVEIFTKLIQKQKNISRNKRQTKTPVHNGFCLSRIQDRQNSIIFQERPERGNTNNLDFSCIAQNLENANPNTNNNLLDLPLVANRTRKRKRRKLHNRIEDQSTISPSIDKAVITDLRSNTASRRRSRILSTSSEDTENELELANYR